MSIYKQQQGIQNNLSVSKTGDQSRYGQNEFPIFFLSHFRTDMRESYPLQNFDMKYGNCYIIIIKMENTQIQKISGQPNFFKRISNSYQIQKGKYKAKGLCVVILGIGGWVGLIFLIFHFTLLPQLLKVFWPYVQFSVSDKWLMGLTIIILNVFINLTYNIVMYFICTLKIPFFQQYRVSNTPWPWEKNYESWKIMLKKVILITFVNYLIVSPLVMFLDLYFGSPCLLRTVDAPTTIQILWQFAIFLIVQDFGLYMAHSTIHNPKIYWIHKIHHQFHTTIAIASNYSHPIQFILVSVPTLLGYKLIHPFYPVHIFTLIIWLTYRIAQTCDAHCGYQWPWAQAALFPMSGGSEYHNFHHSKNAGNYCGFFKFWDCVYNTNKYFVQMKLKQNQKAIEQQDKRMAKSE